MPQIVGAAADAVVRARGRAEQLNRLFHRSRIPMVMIDDDRRHVDANPPARLALRLSMAEMRTFVADDLAPPDALPLLEETWARLLATGCVAGPYEVAGPDGSRFEVVYCAIANALPGRHVSVFAPARWPEEELDELAVSDGESPPKPLTPRELQVLQLAAEGLSGPAIAERLVVSPGTVKTHFQHIHEKLGVHGRVAAVARGMRHGLID